MRIEVSRHFYFGCVRVCKADESSTAYITIVDNFSRKRVTISLGVEGAADVRMDSTLFELYFSFQLNGEGSSRMAVRLFVYVHAEELWLHELQALYSIERRDEVWIWERLNSIDLAVEKLEMPDLKSQWAHWEEWNRPVFSASPALYVASAPPAMLVCTQSSAFVLRVPKSGESASVLECINRGESKRTGLRLAIGAVFRKVCAGADHLLLLDTTGTAWAIGSGNHGELGQQTLESDWSKVEPVEALEETGSTLVDIAAGSWHCVALTGDGDLYGWGWNKTGQLGYSPEEFTIQPTPYPFDIDKRVVGLDAKGDWTAVQLEDGSQTRFGEDNSLG